MEKIQEFFTENSHIFGLLLAAFGVFMLISAIRGSKWLFHEDVSRVSYNLKKIDGLINMFGIKTARVFTGIAAVCIIISGLLWFFISVFRE